MIVSVPACARGEEPVTGASSIRTPRSASAAAIRRLSSGRDRRHVDAQQPLARGLDHAVLARAAPRRPARRRRPCSRRSRSRARPLPACRRRRPARARPPTWRPCRACASRRSAESRPRATRAAIREPMIPRPRKPTDRSSPAQVAWSFGCIRGGHLPTFCPSRGLGAGNSSSWAGQGGPAQAGVGCSSPARMRPKNAPQAAASSRSSVSARC